MEPWATLAAGVPTVLETAVFPARESSPAMPAVPQPRRPPTQMVPSAPIRRPGPKGRRAFGLAPAFSQGRRLAQRMAAAMAIPPRDRPTFTGVLR